MYTNDYFQRWYGKRSVDFYAPVLGQIVTLGLSGNLVDLGAGTGLLAELARRWGFEITALEASPFAVEQASPRDLPDLAIRTFDLKSRLPFGDESVANVVLNQVIEHLEPNTCDAVLRECFRILRQDGRLFVYSPSRRNRAERNADPTHIRLFLPSELEHALEGVGFHIIASPNSGFWFLPRSRLGRGISHVLLRVLPHDWLSASANAVGVRHAALPAIGLAARNPNS